LSTRNKCADKVNVLNPHDCWSGALPKTVNARDADVISGDKSRRPRGRVVGAPSACRGAELW